MKLLAQSPLLQFLNGRIRQRAGTGIRPYVGVCLGRMQASGGEPDVIGL